MLYNIITKLPQISSSREITVNSSCYAVDFYHKLGFKDLEPEKEIGGIKFTPMKIEL